MPTSTQRSIFTPPDRVVAERCVTCDHPIDTAYCPSCGERRASDRTYSIWEFIKDHVIESVVSFDGRVLRTVKLLVTRPGALTAAFMRGVRLPYVAPLQLFFLFNLGFFLWSSAIGYRVFDTPLTVHIGGQPYSGAARRLVQARLVPPHDTPADQKAFAARFDAIGTAQARSLVVVMVPAFAIMVGLLLIDRRRSFIQHVVFAFHTYSAWLLLLVVSTYVIDVPLVALLRAMHVKPGAYGYDAQTALAMLVPLIIYVAISLRTAYHVGRVRAALTAPVLGIGIYVILQAYRALLFFVTLGTM